MFIRRLPYEIVSYIAGDLDLCDVFNLSLTCQHFRYLSLEGRICRTVLESTSPAASETRLARQSGEYPRALRRLAKRRMAVSSASPFLVAVVAHCQRWIYENGVLCYTQGCELRILNIHGSVPRMNGGQEMAVNVEDLLEKQDSQPQGCPKFYPLYYACDIISGVYILGKSKRLVVFRLLEDRVSIDIPLRSSRKIFVRNNDQYLVFGTCTNPGIDGFKHWVFSVYKIKTWERLGNETCLSTMIGSDVGSTVYFDIADGYFYGISNQTTLEAEEGDWTSYYYCFRFPLSHPGSQNVEWAPKSRMWRRYHIEGPIDDGWTFLRAYTDESSGKLKVMESRKEWLSGHSSATRTYYTQRVLFGDDDEDGGEEGAQRDEEEPREKHEEGGQGQGTESPYPIYDPMAIYARKEGVPKLKVIPHRRAEDVQLGDDGSVSIMFTLSKSPIRSYHPVCQSFLDLVDDPPYDSASWNDQRLRLRVGSRHLRESGERQERLRACKEAHGGSHSWRHKIDALYEQKEVVFWPADPHSTGSNPVNLEKLYEVLNPPGFVGNVGGTWDDRSLVYSTGGDGSSQSRKALVLISFDPAISLEGVAPFDDTDDRHQSGSLRPDTPQQPQAGSPVESTGGEGESVGHSTKETDARPELPKWVFQPALYRTIHKGYHFFAN